MRCKLLFVVCFFLVVTSIVGCRKKNPSSEQHSENQATQQKVEQTQLTNQAVSDEMDKSETVERLPKEPVPAVEVSEPEEDTEYFAVFMEGKKVGYAVHKRLLEEDKVTSTEELSLTLNRAGIPMSVGTVSESFETPDGKPLGFKCVMDLGLMKVDISGTVQPDGRLILVTRSPGSVQEKESVQENVVEWPDGALMSEGLRLLREEKGIKEGTEYLCRVFDPTMARAFNAKIIIGAKEQVDLLGRVVALTEETTLLSMPKMGEMASKSYLDEDLRLQKSVSQIMGFSMEMVACSREFALGENDVLELVSKMFIDSPVPLGDISSAKSITYHLEPLPGANLVIPENDNQRVRQLDSGKIVLTITPVTASSGVRFPYRGDNEAALKFLEPTSYVQSDNKVIIDLARRAVGRTKDAAEAVRRIEAFVADYVDDKNLSVGYASAVEVASSRQGDCTEHAVLAAALCRAVGIPAQVVTGLAYVDEWRTVQNGFGGHAWTQAYVGDKWVGLDAAFKGTGRGGYDAGHIALAAGNGDPGDFFSLVTSMGQFRIAKIEVRR